MNFITSRSSIIITIFAALTSCSAFAQGLVSSLSVNLPPRPLLAGQGELYGGSVLLTEGGPHLIDQGTTVGGEVAIRHALSNRLTLGVKGWADVEGIPQHNGLRSGISTEAIAMLPTNDTNRSIALMPRGAVLFDGSSLKGAAAGLLFVVWLPRKGIVSPYGTLGPIVQWNLVPIPSDYLDPRPALSGPDTRLEYGAIINLGVSIQLAQTIRANLELAGGVQSSIYTHRTYGIFVPSAGVAWMF